MGVGNGVEAVGRIMWLDNLEVNEDISVLPASPQQSGRETAPRP